MTSRFPWRPSRALVPLAQLLTVILPLGLTGCGDAFNAGPLTYAESEKLTTDPSLKDQPALQQTLRKALVDLFGPDPQHIKVPEGSGLPGGGIYLGNYQDLGNGKIRRIALVPPGGSRHDAVPQQGGYALYRKHCLHCHGVSGAGDGPTSAFLYPRPRDYRKGLYKFTSTPTGAKPTRDDLRKTIREGLHGTSMPAFEALMTESEIEQVIDYTIFLSMRGETELALIDEASSTGELSPEAVADVSRSIFEKWTSAGSQVINPPTPCPPSTPESVARGRDIYLGRNRTGNRVDCTSCHGARGKGDGPSFVNPDVFNTVVFGSGQVNRRFMLSSGELTILQALTDLEAASKTRGHQASEIGKAPTQANLVAAFQRDLGLTAKDDLAAIHAKAGYDPKVWGEAPTAEKVVENLLHDLEDKSLVDRSYGFGGTTLHAAIDRKTGELWNNSLDDWGNPLRPADLNRGIYKGGRRPIDLYWRIAKGINGAKMPAHFPTIPPESIWDVVNFVLALPDEPTLLEGVDLPAAAPPSPAVARR